MNLLDYLNRASARLDEAGVSFGHGTTNAFDEAAWLVLWRLALPLDDLDGAADRVLTDAEIATLDAFIGERIATRRPAAYLTGEAWLQGVPFTVDERVIVPRSLIAEVLAEGLIDPWLPAQGRPRAGPVHRQRQPGRLRGDGVAPGGRRRRRPVRPTRWRWRPSTSTRHELAKRITLHQGDGLRAVRRDRRYDLILCNPPYVNATAMSELPPEFRAEPEMALAGGVDGMDFIRTLLARAAPT
jgi:ribosomal protein L3 glutamine methyltransferase